MKIRKTILPVLLLLYCSLLAAQVQVSNEPRHKKVFENKYIRLLDVWLPPGDTSLFHIHSTPSLFLVFTGATVVSQIKGQVWVKEQMVPGTCWYRSFFQDTLIHRVGNSGTTVFHVNDIEILSPWDNNNSLAPLPFPVLYNYEKAIAYKLTDSSFHKQAISNRGPMIAELVAGVAVYYTDVATGKKILIKEGSYLYIGPGSVFHLSSSGKEKVNMVLFEIK